MWNASFKLTLSDCVVSIGCVGFASLNVVCDLFYCLLDLRSGECDIYPCMFCVALLMDLFVLCVACL